MLPQALKAHSTFYLEKQNYSVIQGKWCRQGVHDSRGFKTDKYTFPPWYLHTELCPDCNNQRATWPTVEVNTSLISMLISWIRAAQAFVTCPPISMKLFVILPGFRLKTAAKTTSNHFMIEKQKMFPPKVAKQAVKRLVALW